MKLEVKFAGVLLIALMFSGLVASYGARPDAEIEEVDWKEESEGVEPGEEIEAQVEVKSTYIRSFKDEGKTYYLRMRGYCENGWNRGIYPIENQGEVVSTGPMREGETREVEVEMEVEEIYDSGGSTCGTTGDVDNGGLVVVPVLRSAPFRTETVRTGIDRQLSRTEN